MQCRRDAGTVTASNRYNNSYTYADLRGNISNLQRNGLYLNGACFTQALLDNMTYSYTAGTNKISSIADAGNTAQGGFRASSGAMTYQRSCIERSEHQDDANGNMISNAAKGISSISYNHLNLPTNITITGSKTIDFIYSADGNKLRKVVKTSATINLVQEYINGIEYRGTAIPATSVEAAYHLEGRLYNSTGSWKREYTIKDHLGNTRIAYCDLDNNGVVATPSEILQENNYDAFGYELSGVYINHVNSDNLYQYNGKEKNDDHGIGMYDYGARWYDAGVGRWTTVDPMSDKRSWVSPYNYVQNNPILRNDPTGALDEGPIDRILGSITAVLDNATGGFTGMRQLVTNNYSGDKKDFNAGLRQGDIVSLAVGTAEGATGAAVVEGSVTATVATGGLAIEVAAPAAVVGAVMTVHGTIMAGSAARNLLNPTKVEAKENRRAKGEHQTTQSETTRNKHEQGAARKQREQNVADEKYSASKSTKVPKSNNQVKKEDPNYKRLGPKAE